MKLSHFFIDHPRFAAVINIFIMVFGFAAAAFLPVAQYPNIVPPTVQITTAYPGVCIPGVYPGNGRFGGYKPLILPSSALGAGGYGQTGVRLSGSTIELEWQNPRREVQGPFRLRSGTTAATIGFGVQMFWTGN